MNEHKDHQIDYEFKLGEISAYCHHCKKVVAKQNFVPPAWFNIAKDLLQRYPTGVEREIILPIVFGESLK